MKAIVCSSPDNFFVIVAGVLQGDKLVPYMFIICLDYVFWTSIDLIKENGFIQKKKKKQNFFSVSVLWSSAPSPFDCFHRINCPVGTCKT